jgi:hypothetical protein
MKHLLKFPGFQIEAGVDWNDITDSLDYPECPFTVAKQAGVGALQFSPALYRGGPLPWPTKDDLLFMAIEFGQNHGLGQAFDTNGFEGSLTCAGASYQNEGDFIGVWYLSDKKSIILATYVCEWRCRYQELPECEEIIRSLQFGDLNYPKE